MYTHKFKSGTRISSSFPAFSNFFSAPSFPSVLSRFPSAPGSRSHRPRFPPAAPTLVKGYFMPGLHAIQANFLLLPSPPPPSPRLRPLTSSPLNSQASLISQRTYLILEHPRRRNTLIHRVERRLWNNNPSFGTKRGRVLFHRSSNCQCVKRACKSVYRRKDY